MKAYSSFLLSITLSLVGAVSMYAADGDTKPEPVKTPPPEYPSDLKREGVSGLVAVKVTIDEKGNVTDCTVAKSTDPRFDASAVTAVRNWKFKPASKAGVKVSSTFVVPLKFAIDEG